MYRLSQPRAFMNAQSRSFGIARHRYSVESPNRAKSELSGVRSLSLMRRSINRWARNSRSSNRFALHGAEHATHGVAVDAESRTVGEAEEPGIDVERPDGVEQWRNHERRAGEERAHLILDDPSDSRVMKRPGQRHPGEFVDGPEPVLLPP